MAPHAPLDDHRRRGFFGRRLHFMQIIRQRDNGEEDQERAGQRDDALPVARVAPAAQPPNREVAEQTGVTRNSDQGPRQIEREFHGPHVWRAV